MNDSDRVQSKAAAETWPNSRKLQYDTEMQAIRTQFEAHAEKAGTGLKAIASRSAAVDAIVQSVWADLSRIEANVRVGVTVVAVGGYGRRELFPFSDVDLLVLLDAKTPERLVKEPIRRLNQTLWDAGLRVSSMTRVLPDCGNFDAANVEFTLSLLDARYVTGDQHLFATLAGTVVPELLAKDHLKIAARLTEVTRSRHGRYGETLFHLEPNVKECLGGLRDAHVCAWLATLQASDVESHGMIGAASTEFAEASHFLTLVRTFLHFRNGRDDNALDWQAQDMAAEISLGMDIGAGLRRADAAYWMRHYFRHARSIERRIGQFLDESRQIKPSIPLRRFTGGAGKLKRDGEQGYEVRQNRIALVPGTSDPAHDPEVVLAIFATMAKTGARLMAETETNLEDALPLLSAHLEDGPNLWHNLRAILLGGFAGRAMRSMHALGILELLIPEFHGIDALVIRDAYHRYTVDEHTFVVLDTLHGLNSGTSIAAELEPWANRFAGIFRELPHPELLLLAALLHDTGKGHAAADHSVESARMAADVLGRLELDSYETGLVLDLIRNHLEMSAALRRDVFDPETIRAFAARVPNPEGLRMLALFTYADIAAVHPDALTPWKAENLWRLYQATAHFLDRNVDDGRVAADADSALGEVLLRVHALLPGRRAEVTQFLEGFPGRYLQTRTPETVALHAQMVGSLEDVTLNFRWAIGMSELTLVTTDRPRLFATVAGALASWGMNIVTADAFSNAHGIVVDSFRFSDTFRTLELNESERDRFVSSLRSIITGTADLEVLLASRRRGRRMLPKVVVKTRIAFDQFASSHSTLLEVVAQDSPGVLLAVSRTLAEQQCNIEVALIDTEGEMAIDVFYITRHQGKLDPVQKIELRAALLEAIERNAR